MIRNLSVAFIAFASHFVDCVGAQAQSVKLEELPKQMPQTQRMKLAGDVASYVKAECGRDVMYKLCEMFVQDDPKGSLVGYLMIYQMPDNSIVFQTDTVTNNGKECLIGGNFDGQKFDSAADFKERSSFSYKRGADVAGGMFYVERRGPRLRVNDERWNYCYSNKHIDDVWRLIGRATLL